MYATLIQAFIISLLASQLIFRTDSLRTILRLLFAQDHNADPSFSSPKVQTGDDTSALHVRQTGRRRRNNGTSNARTTDTLSPYPPRTTILSHLDGGDSNIAASFGARTMLERIRGKLDIIPPIIRQDADIPLDNFTATDPEATVLPPKISSEDCKANIHAQPTCNAAHEIGWEHSLSTQSLQRIHFGGTRNVWRVIEDQSMQEAEMQTNQNLTVSFALKTLRWKRNFSRQTYDVQQKEAVALNYLSNTPGVLGIYGYCGTSLMSEYANRDTLSAFLKKSNSRVNPIRPIQLLQMAWWLARAVANVQRKERTNMGIGYKTNATELQVIHRDLDASNILLTRTNKQGGLWDVRLDDFNQAYILSKHSSQGDICTYQDQFICGEDGRRPDARAPEECRGDSNLSNKVDTYGLGTVMFYLLTHRRIYSLDADAPGPAKNNIAWYRDRVKQGDNPQLPELIESDSDKATRAIIEAMKMCMESEPAKRPSAQMVADFLLREFNVYIARMSSKAKAKTISRHGSVHNRAISSTSTYFPRVLAWSNNGQVERTSSYEFTVPVKRKRRKSRQGAHLKLQPKANGSGQDTVKSDNSTCVPYATWSRNTYPTCNSIHEVNSLLQNSSILGAGANSLAWSMRDTKGEAIVLRNQRFDKEFVAAAFARQHTDAIILEKLSTSPHVLDIFGYCGVSTINEYADGGDLYTFFYTLYKRGRKFSPEQKLSIVKDALLGMADLHSIDGADMATVMQRDVSFSNMAVVSSTDEGGERKWKVKWHDFNMARFLQWDFQQNRTCGWGHSFACDGKWKRTPEDCINTTVASILPVDYPRERKDLYSLGTMMFLLLNERHPYSYETNRILPDKEYLKLHPARNYYPTYADASQIKQWLREGRAPSFSNEVEESKDPSILSVKSAVRRALNPDIYQRPSAQWIADRLI